MNAYVVYGYSRRDGSTTPCYVSANSEREAIVIASTRYDYYGNYAIER